MINVFQRSFSSHKNFFYTLFVETVFEILNTISHISIRGFERKPNDCIFVIKQNNRFKSSLKSYSVSVIDYSLKTGKGFAPKRTE